MSEGRAGEDTRILVVEDDPGFAACIEMVLGPDGEGYEIELCDDGLAALEMAEADSFDVVLTDFRLPGMGGLELLTRLREGQPMRPVIMMTGNGSTELAIEATKAGAYDYLLKPFELDDLVDIVAQAVQASRTMQSRMPMGEAAPPGAPSLIGSCPAMQNVYKEIGRIASTDVTVLILGETGSGKELVATAVYQHSERNTGPFVAVNCGAIPENLLESELFGHVRGAFTGATADRIGRFQQADGGTLFLDEVGDLPLAVQVKLLRVLQEGVVQPLGSSRESRVDVRILAATHQPLQELIAAGKFREDLYYRINSAVIHLPPLRERGEDVLELIRHFADEAATEFRMPAPKWTKAVMTLLADHPWPGNVRELRNVIGQLLLRSRGYSITPELVEEVLGGEEPASAVDAELGSENDVALDFSSVIEGPVRMVLADARREGEGQVHDDLVSELEQQMIRTALDLAGGHLGKVCAWLGISRVTLRKKIAIYGLEGSPERESGKKVSTN